MIKRRGLMLVLSSPSGAGKTTISRALLESDDNLGLSISVTTRLPRRGERPGIDYHFIDRGRFDEMVAGGELLEHATVFDNCYGTPRVPVEATLAAGRDVLFDIDWQGARQLREAMSPQPVVGLFILPPSHDALAERLRSRAQDSEEVVRQRMSRASSEMDHYDRYEYVLVNDDLEKTIADAKAILRAERLRRERLVGLNAFVSSLQSAS